MEGLYCQLVFAYVFPIPGKGRVGIRSRKQITVQITYHPQGREAWLLCTQEAEVMPKRRYADIHLHDEQLCQARWNICHFIPITKMLQPNLVTIQCVNEGENNSIPGIRKRPGLQQNGYFGEKQLQMTFISSMCISANIQI